MHVYSMRKKGQSTRCGAAQASCQGKYSPAFKGSWLRAWTTEAMEISSLLSWQMVSCFSAGAEGNRETHLELCSAVQFVVPDLIKGCVGGSTEGKEKGDKWEEQAAALHQRALVCSMLTAEGGRTARPQVSSLSSPVGSRIQSWP